MTDVRIYCVDRLPGLPVLLLVDSFAGISHTLGSALFLESSPSDFSYRGFTFTDTRDEADYFLYPHPVIRPSKSEAAHIEEAKRQARSLGKPLIVFIGSDLAYGIRMDEVVVLKGSQYRYQTHANEIIMPHFVEDLGTRRPFSVRTKSERPIVSFCGWVSPTDPSTRLRMLLKNTYFGLLALLPGQAHMVVRKKGLWWRARSIKRLKEAPGIDTRFIERSTFSGSKKTIALDPAQAREEYLENMYDSDFVLAPKGDANISLRFYEALSMGRIPILIDTEVVLPAEDVLDYDSFVLKIPYQDIDRIAAIVEEFYAGLTDERFGQMQKNARDAFAHYVRYDAFFNYLFQSLELQRAIQAARA
jgi:hypothetical protein